MCWSLQIVWHRTKPKLGTRWFSLQVWIFSKVIHAEVFFQLQSSGQADLILCMESLGKVCLRSSLFLKNKTLKLRRELCNQTQKSKQMLLRGFHSWVVLIICVAVLSRSLSARTFQLFKRFSIIKRREISLNNWTQFKKGVKQHCHSSRKKSHKTCWLKWSGTQIQSEDSSSASNSLILMRIVGAASKCSNY